MGTVRMLARSASIMAVALPLLSLLAGCSLVKLSDEISQAHCKTDSDCDVLNDHKSSSFNPCKLWQCGDDTKYCELGALDADHDGYSPASIMVEGEDVMCEDDAAKQDCADDNSARKPGLKETCDSLDNDCDGNVDEGELMNTSNVSVELDASSGGAIDTSYAIDPESNTLALAYSIANGTNDTPGLTLIADGLPSGNAVGDIVLPAKDTRTLITDGVGVGALGTQRFAVAFYWRSGNHRVAAGVIQDNTPPFTLGASSDILSFGLRCSKTEKNCQGDPKKPDEPFNTPQTVTPSIAAVGDDVVVGYVRNPGSLDPDTECNDKDASVAAQPVLLNLLSDASSDGLSEVGDEAFVLGQTDSPAAPALLAMPKLPVGATTKDFGWLVAYPDADGVINVQRVTRDGKTIVASDALASIGSGKTVRYKDVHMALGPQTDDGQQVGITYQLGCTTNARIAFSLLEVKLSDADKATVSLVATDVMVGGVANESHPAVAYSKERKSWGVVYRNPKGLNARIVDTSGKATGTSSYVIIDNVTTGPNSSRVLLSPAIVPLRTDTGWFGALSYAEQSKNPTHVFIAATLASCQKTKP